MKKPIILLAALAVAVTACGPAAEDRNVMQSRSKIFQDSIANEIRVRMMEAETPANNAVIMNPSAAPVQPQVQPQGQPQQAPPQPQQQQQGAQGKSH